MSKLIKKIEKIDKYWIFSKQSITATILIILFVVFNPFIKTFISEWLVFNPNNIESSYLFDFIVGIVLIFGGLFIWHKIQIAYRASFLHYLFLGIIILPYWVYRFSNVGWEYLKIKLLPDNMITIAYLDIVIILLMFYPIFILLKITLSKRKKDEQYSRTVFVEDAPIKYDKDDKLGYKNIVSKILTPIIDDNYEKAFTIGLVGPWGNGKSSLLGLFKEELKKKDTKNIIEVEFSPFLNHNEKDIISDFFDALCSKLKRFDGTLHKDISNYSDALLKLYKTGNIASLLDLNIDVDKSLPVYDLYNKIDTSLGKINKKIIVYVDDLDRLNPIEISETLKLIRNTANFTNIVFIVALDKDYVIKTLKGDNSNKHYKFLEKFFQLEVYLPEIPQKILEEEFIKSLKNCNDFKESDIILINNALTNNRNHFSHFIHNIRDVKRLVNQLIFESKFVFEDIDTNDYLNFIFLKINFPKFIQLLNERKEDFLKIKNGKFSLIEADSNGGEKQDEQEIIDVFESLNSFTVNPKRYKISSVFYSENENCFKSILGIDCVESKTLISVLVALFGEQDDLPYNSIQFERNFYKVMRLSYAEDDLRESDFNQLLKKEESDSVFNDTLENLLSKNLGEQLITRINYHQIKSKDELISLTKALFYFWKRCEHYNLYLSEITRILSKYLNLNNGRFELIDKKFKLTSKDTKVLVQKHFFHNKGVDTSLKVRLLALLKENEYETGLWGFDKSDLNDLGIGYFEEYLNKYKDKMWEINDYTFYNYYHQLKHICKQTELSNIFKNYLKEVENIEVFCSQSLDIEPFSILIYGVNDFILTLFEKYLEFKEFILNHKSSKYSKGVQEYLEFYDLLLICNFQYRRKFIFKDLPLKDYSAQGRVNERERLECESLVQLHLVFDKSLTGFGPSLNSSGLSFSFNYFMFKDRKYLFIGTTQVNERDCLSQVFNFLKERLQNHYVEKKFKIVIDLENSSYIENESGNKLIELFNIQYGK